MTESSPSYFRDALAEFLLDPSKSALFSYLKNQLGEQPAVDYKAIWPKKEQLAKHLIGMANVGGGIFLMGVAEREDKTVDARGLLDSFKDGSELNEQLATFIPTYLLEHVKVYNFQYNFDEDPSVLRGKKFQALIVEGKATELPYYSLKTIEGHPDGTIFIRRASKTAPADASEREQLLKRRDDAVKEINEQLELKGHLQQLKTLYGAISSINRPSSMFNLQLGDSILRSLYGSAQPNPEFPNETYDRFVSRMISAKKNRIQRELGL